MAVETLLAICLLRPVFKTTEKLATSLQTKDATISGQLDAAWSTIEELETFRRENFFSKVSCDAVRLFNFLCFYIS